MDFDLLKTLGPVLASISSIISSVTNLLVALIKSKKNNEPGGETANKNKLAAMFAFLKQKRVFVLGIFISNMVTIIVCIVIFSFSQPAKIMSSDAFIDDFETGISPKWQNDFNIISIKQASQIAFSGHYALQAAVDLQRNGTNYEQSAVADLLLTESDLANKTAVFRIYVPPQAPTNLAVAFYLKDNKGNWISGPSRALQVGSWQTVNWSIRDARPWEAPAKGLGVQFILTPAASKTDQMAYSGVVYVDLVELNNTPNTTLGGPLVDNILQPYKYYDFENSLTVPAEIKALGDKNNLTLPTIAVGEAYLPYGSSALRLNANLSSFDSLNNTGYSSIFIDLGQTKRIDAMLSHVFIPDRVDIHNAQDFRVFYIAEDAQGYPVYSGDFPVTIGKWTPFFWGTKFAYSGGILCEDSNKDGQCDQPARNWWSELKDPEIKGVEIRVIRNNGNYQGPIYLDGVTLYQATSPY